MSLLLVALFVTACASEGAVPTDEEAVQADQEADSKDYTGGTPWLDCDIDSNVTADTPTDPKDNYALYANKDALLSLELTDDSPAAGRMVTMANQASEDIKQMFLKDRPESHDARLAYDLFWLMKDWDSRNALGVAPLKERIDAVEAISTIDDLTTYLSTTAPEDQLGLLWSNGEKKDHATDNKEDVKGLKRFFYSVKLNGIEHFIDHLKIVIGRIQGIHLNHILVRADDGGQADAKHEIDG